MTVDINVLSDTLCRRIARGGTGERDLGLLLQLRLCERRRYLVIGAVAGIGVAAVLQIILIMMR